MLTAIDEQSPDIAMGVNEALEIRGNEGADLDRIGAGDQGMMFGFACDETPERMPLPISLAHRLAGGWPRRGKRGAFLSAPRRKTQVTVEYDGHTPVRVEAVVVSTQHSETVSLETIRQDVIERVIRPIIPAGCSMRTPRFL